jgi:hypothetical protein
MSRIDDENWATLEELLEEWHHPEHGLNDVPMSELTARLQQLSEKNYVEIAWDDEINEPIFRLTTAAYEKYRPRHEQNGGVDAT